MHRHRPFNYKLLIVLLFGRLFVKSQFQFMHQLIVGLLLVVVFVVQVLVVSLVVLKKFLVE